MQFTRIFRTAAVAALILTCSACKKDNPVTPEPGDHVEAEGLVAFSRDSAIVIISKAVVTGGFTAKNGFTTDTLGVYFLDADSVLFRPTESNKSFDYSVADTSVATVAHVSGTYTFAITGRSPGRTTIVLRLLHAGHPDFLTPSIPISVAAK